MLVAQLCLTLCNLLTEGSTVNGIFRARIPEWVTMPSSMDRSRVWTLNQGLNPHLLCLLHWQASSLPTSATCEALTHTSHYKSISFFFSPDHSNQPTWGRIVRTWPHHSENSFAMELISEETTKSLINLPTCWRVCVQTRKYRAPTAGSIPSTNMAESWNLKLL